MERVGTLGLLVLAVFGCYHATVDTGLPRSNRTIEKHWASSWIGGLVPPETVETAERCPDGVAKVETKQTFLNQVVGVITLGIYTPMYIEVTCAARGVTEDGNPPAVQVRPEATDEQKREALMEAAALSETRGGAVLVRF